MGDYSEYQEKEDCLELYTTPILYQDPYLRQLRACSTLLQK